MSRAWACPSGEESARRCGPASEPWMAPPGLLSEVRRDSPLPITQESRLQNLRARCGRRHAARGERTVRPGRRPDAGRRWSRASFVRLASPGTPRAPSRRRYGSAGRPGTEPRGTARFLISSYTTTTRRRHSPSNRRRSQRKVRSRKCTETARGRRPLRVVGFGVGWGSAPSRPRTSKHPGTRALFLKPSTERGRKPNVSGRRPGPIGLGILPLPSGSEKTSTGIGQ